MLVDSSTVAVGSVARLRSLGQRPAWFVLDPEGRRTHSRIGTGQHDLPPVDEIVEPVAAAR